MLHAEQLGELLGLRPGGDLQLDRGAEVAHHDVVIVVAGEEHQPLAAQLLGQQVEERLGLSEGIFDRCEQQVEDIAEQDQLVDAVQVRLERVEREPVAQERIARPCTKVHVGDGKRAHLIVSRSAVRVPSAAAGAWRRAALGRA